MSSLRSKINTKFKKQEEEYGTNFDETSIRINVVGGQTQLCPIKLNCSWVNPGRGPKIPELKCKWFKKTTNSFDEIVDVTGTYYQPCLQDVGTIIHIQCIPEFEGCQYEGMPISKDVGPIKLDPETEEEGNDLLEAKKASFFIKILDDDDHQTHHQGLIKILDNSTIKIISRQNEQKQLISDVISGTFPTVDIQRNSPKLIVLQILENKFTIQFSNNKVRDIFVLLVRLISLQTPNSQTKPPPKQEQIVNESKIEESSPQKDHDKNSQKDSQKNSQIQSQKDHQSQESKEGKSQSKSKDGSIIEEGNLKFVRSEGDFTVESSQKLQKKNQKKNIQATLEAADFKEKLRSMQMQLQEEKKRIKQINESFQATKHEMQIMKERQTNFNHNYRLLEEQFKTTKEDLIKIQEEMSYYKNECRLAKLQKETYEKKYSQAAPKIASLEEKLSHFEEKDESVSYAELNEGLQREREAREHLESVLEVEKRHLQKSQQAFSELREYLQKVEIERNQFKRKYQNLKAELIRNPNLEESVSETHSSPLLYKSMTQLSLKNGDSAIMEGQDSQQNRQRMQAQILALKKQLKDSIEESNFLRSINMSGKQKSKIGSKSHLKTELVQMKKIVNRLTEALTEKDIALQNMKKINRDLNQKMGQKMNTVKPA